jgi:hypothetical protein
MKLFPPESKQDGVRAPVPPGRGPKAQKIAQKPTTGTRKPKLLDGFRICSIGVTRFGASRNLVGSGRQPQGRQHDYDLHLCPQEKKPRCPESRR